ncbi:precorrin-8X methylmutase [Candidatus Hodgkinia cicadicola]
MFRSCSQIVSASLWRVSKRIGCVNWTECTWLAAYRLYHCFSFNLFRYCVYVDGFFEKLSAILNENSVVFTDTSALKHMLVAKGTIKVYSIVGLNKIDRLARDLQCTKSCVQFDVLSILLTRIVHKKAVFVIATSPTSLLRLVELMRACVIAPSAIIACPVGLVNCDVSKRKLWFGRFKVPFLIVRGRMGGVAFGAAVLNSVIC